MIDLSHDNMLGRRPAVFLFLLLLWVLVSSLLIHALPPAQPFYSDSTRDILLARQCISAHSCRLVGAYTSAPGVYNGAVFTLYLALLWLLGVGIHGMVVVTVIMWAMAMVMASYLGVVLTPSLKKRWIRGSFMLLVLLLNLDSLTRRLVTIWTP